MSIEKNKKILVLGKTGMLGSVVFTTLSKHEVWNVDGTQRLDSTQPFYFDVERLAGLKVILSRVRYDYIINCIGVLKSAITESDSGSILRSISINSLFPHQLAQAALKMGSRIIHISTDGVFSGRSTEPYFEDSPCDCLDYYGKTKALGECPSENVINIRCSVIGRDKAKGKGLLEWFLHSHEKAIIAGFQDRLWNGVTTIQFAKLCESVIEENKFELLRNESHVHHFCPNRVISKYDLLRIFRKATGKRITIQRKSFEDGPISLVLGTRLKALRHLYSEKKSWEELVRELIN